MKYGLLFLILISYQSWAQQENNPTLFLPLEEVDNPPAFPGCEAEEFKFCSSQRIATFLMQEIDPQLLFSLEEAENYVNIRFIVDTSGKVRRPMANTTNENLRDAANTVLSTLPNFKPGTHNDQPVNVIIEVPVKLSRAYPEAENSLTHIENDDPGSISPSPVKTSPIALACDGSADREKCSINWVQTFVMRNFNTDKFQPNGKFLKVIIRFVIDEGGKVTNVTAEGENERLNKEAIKAVKKLPDFLPATEEGKNVSYDYAIPFTLHSSR